MYINITALTVVKIILLFILFYFLFIIRDVLVVLFISLVLASAFDPWVDWMQNKKIPRGIGIVIIYLGVFLLFGGAIALIIPPIIDQIKELSSTFPALLSKAMSTFSALRDYSVQHGLIDNVKEYLGSMTSNLGTAAGGVYSTVTSFFDAIFSFFLILVITFYMVVAENAMKKLVVSLAPTQYQVYIMQLINRMQKKVGLWLRGQIILSFTIFLLTYIGLLILRVKYALVLALIAGLMECIPYIGPTISAIPAIFLSFFQAPILAAFVAVLYYIVQLVENNIVVPKLMQKVVGLNPIVSIAVLLIGFKVAGIVGAILSIPVATAGSVFLLDLFENHPFAREEKE